LDLVPSKLHIVMVNLKEKFLVATQSVPGIAFGSRKRSNRVTALLVFYFIPMQPTPRMDHPSLSSHPDAKKYSYKHPYYKSRNVVRGNEISGRQYPASQFLGTRTAGSAVSHQCHQSTKPTLFRAGLDLDSGY
jgi:hypothetical protein